MTTRFATSADGTKIAYDTTGRGPALMLLHGAGKTRRDWHTLGYVKRLKEDFTVITVDIRGSGESTFLTEMADYAIHKICQDVITVADACNTQRFALWGFSFGGNIARYLGAWSNRVTALAVVGVPLGPAVDKAFGHFIDEFVEKWKPLADAYRTGTLNDKKRKSAIKGRIPVWLACFQAMRAWPSIEPGQLGCPTLLLVGSKNRNTLDWVAANRAPLDSAKIQIEIIAGLNHQQEFSKIGQVFSPISSFLKQHGMRLEEDG